VLVIFRKVYFRFCYTDITSSDRVKYSDKDSNIVRLFMISHLVMMGQFLLISLSP